ncbi:Cfr10I/Bse634I family restriction endonuclease, partial [Phormidium sp. CCY1219]|uniref:Cfr10I/Bse634I family restriction endonuclease n=1 Tax=Phormidium sp. CCY1219 TaxID=2886104 RepID=UPI002D1F31F2
FQPGNPLAAINELKNKIFFSSPDYVIVHLDSTKHPRDKINDLLKEQIKKPNSLNLYDHFKGKILASDVKAAISLKTTNRPDRRYQPLFEAAMLKAINHVANQKWRYYMVTRKFSDNDRIVFMEGISPHGIIVNKRIPLVDGIYPYNTKNDLSSLVTDALT